jgi:hypothetical protein
VIRTSSTEWRNLSCGHESDREIGPGSHSLLSRQLRAGRHSGKRCGEPSTTILISDAIEAKGNTGIYTYGDEGAKTQIRFPIATERADPVLYHDVQRLGESAGVVAVLDSYGSRNGGERCANGRESWVRLFSIAQQRMTDSTPVESCLDRREAGEPPVTWDGNGFTINGREPRRFTIVDGKVQSYEAQNNKVQGDRER